MLKKRKKKKSKRKKRKTTPPVYFGVVGVDPTALNGDNEDGEEGDIDPEDLLIEPRIIMSDPAYKIDHDDKKYPLCVCWQPFNCWS